MPFEPAFTRMLLRVAFKLYNLRTRMVGLSQIRTVYAALWEDDFEREVAGLRSGLHRVYDLGDQLL